MGLMKVQGRGHVYVEPDMVTLSFDVESKAEDYGESVRDLNMRTGDLRGSMSASGLDKAELKTTAFSVRVETQYRDGRHIFAGYVASHRLQIELPMNKKMLNKVLRHVARGHSGAEIRLTFSVKDKDALRKKVLAQAVETARRNAETLAAAAGVTLGKLVEMDYGWAEVQIYNREASMLCESMAAGPGYDADIEPEDVAAVDNVTLVFEITG
jgi:uncharacterized protein YggE